MVHELKAMLRNGCPEKVTKINWNTTVTFPLTLTLWSIWSLSCIASSNDTTWQFSFVCSFVSWRHSVDSAASATQLTMGLWSSNTVHPTNSPNATASETLPCRRQCSLYLPLNGTLSLLLHRVGERQSMPNVCSLHEFKRETVAFVKLFADLLGTHAVLLLAISTFLFMNKWRDVAVILWTFKWQYVLTTILIFDT